MSKKVELLGLLIRCPELGREVSIPRDDYHIGPISAAEKGRYVIDCECGKRHTVKTKPHKLPPVKRRA